MQAKDIKKILESGKSVMVRLIDELWDDSWGEKWMIAQITSCVLNEQNRYVCLDYSVAKEHNMSIQSHDYFIFENGVKTEKLGTAAEAGIKEEIYIKETVYFNENQELPFELIENNSPLSEYIQYLKNNQNAKNLPTYVEWLERELKKEEDFIQEDEWLENQQEERIQKQENDNIPVELNNDNPLSSEYTKYLKDNEGGQYIQTYVEWLEDYIAVLKINIEELRKN